MEFEQLIQRMAPDCRDLFEQAVALASSRSHHQLEIEHLVARIALEPDSATRALLAATPVDRAQLGADVQALLDRLASGHGGFPRISDTVARLLFEAWMVATSRCDALTIQVAHLLLALVENPLLHSRAMRISAEFGKLDADMLLRHGADPLPDAMATADVPGTRTPALDRFTTDLTAQARAGRIDPVLGRDSEIRQVIDILCRRRQNNPILTGEAGVGKTAVVEGLALRIVSGGVPDALRDVSLRTLDLGLLQAGAGVKGEFENRLKGVIQEVQQSLTPIILFIDEAHTLIGAGNQAGSGDAANLLKPALARGELRTIAATTWAEYKRYVESDAALTRRFQVVKVDEPSEAQAIVMLRTLVAPLAAHHGVAILDEAVRAAVTLSHRYIPGRQLPDKCVSLLDTACARVALSQRTPPPALERCQRELAAVEAELAALQREQHSGLNHDARIAALTAAQQRHALAADALQERWREVMVLGDEIATLRALVTAGESHLGGPRADADTLARLTAARAALHQLQEGEPLLHDCVDADVIAAVVADWTGIPVRRMQQEEITQVLTLTSRLTQRVVGQHHALDAIATAMQTASAGLNDPRRPRAVFLLAGPSGVGKTETALALAEQLYGSEQAITVINMSEFKEEHKVSLLMGSPPGYVGYGEGGVLTEAVRRKPYSVVLLDEVEKAHPGVQDIFYQVFDKGQLRDGEGRDIDFRNTVIILTTNAASEQIIKLCADPDTAPEPTALASAIAPALREHFKPAFLGRVTVVPYLPLDAATLAQVTRLQLAALQARVQASYQAELTYGNELVQRITAQCGLSDIGARQVSTQLAQSVLPPLAERILARLRSGKHFSNILIDLDGDDQLCVEFVSEEKSAGITASEMTQAVV